MIEAHQTIQNNNEVWEQSLTGVIRPEDLLPGNRVLSENVAEMAVVKMEQGHMRDSNRRGWFMRFWDFASPF